METFLKEINAIIGVTGSFICLRDHTVAAKVVPHEINDACLEVAARLVCQTFSALDLSGQHVIEADFTFGQGHLILKNLRGGVLVILCSRNVNVPVLNRLANSIAEKIDAVIKTPERATSPVLTSAPQPIATRAAAATTSPATPPTEPHKVLSPIEHIPSPGSAPTPFPAPEPLVPGVTGLSPLLIELDAEMHRIMDAAQSERMERSEDGGRTWKVVATGVNLRVIDPFPLWMYCNRTRNLLPPVEKQQIDFAALAAQSVGVGRVLRRLGYRDDDRFDTAYGNRRQRFFDSKRQISVEVYLDAFEMYHRLDLRACFEQAGTMIGETELLLTRLQYVEMTFGILRELCALFLEHNLSNGPEEGHLNASQIARLCGEDWGWYKTVTMNLDHVSDFAPTLLTGNDRAIIIDRAQRLKTRTESAPKNVRWLTRARLGETVKWYETPVVVPRQ